MSALFSSFSQFILLAVSTWVLFRVFGHYFAKSPLDNIPGPPRGSWLTGHMSDLFHSRDAWGYHQSISDKYGSVSRIRDAFGGKALYVFDPKALQTILVKERSAFELPTWMCARNRIVFGPSLFSATGDHHNRQRKIMNPAFSTPNIRLMTPIFYHVAHQMRDAIVIKVGNSQQEVDILRWVGRAALEMIGQGGLGFSFDPLREAAVEDALKDLVPMLNKFNVLRPCVTYIAKLGTPSFRRHLTGLLPSANVQRMKQIVDTMYDTSRYILNIQSSADKADSTASLKDRNKVKGKDVMSLLLKSHAIGEHLGDEELVSHISTMLFAGTDTTSNALARTLQLLAEHQDIQDELRAELVDAGSGEDTPYERLVGLPLLDAVCRETLRLYPPAPVAMRESGHEVLLPLSTPIIGLDGEVIREILVPAGTIILISILSCNRDKAVWGEDALQWNPSRWLSRLPETVIQARIPGVYSNLMTFLAGGRSCIGFNFSQLELKVVLSVLLQTFKFSSTGKPIVWNFAAVNFPTVDGTNGKASMPLIVSRC